MLTRGRGKFQPITVPILSVLRNKLLFIHLGNSRFNSSAMADLQQVRQMFTNVPKIFCFRAFKVLTTFGSWTRNVFVGTRGCELVFDYPHFIMVL